MSINAEWTNADTLNFRPYTAYESTSVTYSTTTDSRIDTSTTYIHIPDNDEERGDCRMEQEGRAMTATDELRRMLDERGVEHFDGTETTLWGYEPTGEYTGAYRFAADETSGGRMQVRMFNVTPIQAIEATLGRGTCRDVRSKDRIIAFECSECGCWVAYDEYWETGIYVLHETGQEHVHPRFCPNCGRRVVA